MKISTSTRRVGFAVALFVLCFAGTALAQSAQPTVTTTVGSGTRQLAVTDLSGTQLSRIALAVGQPKSFRVTVTDQDYLADRAFTVRSEINNLYLDRGDGSYDFATSIPSGQVGVSFPTGVSVAGVTVDALLDRTVALADGLDAVNCLDTVNTALAAAGLDPVALLTTVTSLCSTVTTVLADAANPLHGGIALDELHLDDIDLGSLPLGGLPTGIFTGSAGPYSNPSFQGAIGARDGAGAGAPAATSRPLLVGTPLVGLVPADLLALVNAALGAVGGATIDAATATAITATLQANTDAAVKTLGDTLAAAGAGAQPTLVDALLDLVTETVDLVDLSDLTGSYTNLPALTVDGTGVAQGTYAGTYTVTLVENS